MPSHVGVVPERDLKGKLLVTLLVIGVFFTAAWGMVIVFVVIIAPLYLLITSVR